MASGLFAFKRLQAVTPTLSRSISVSTVRNGKRNFRKFVLHRRGTKLFQEAMGRGEKLVNYGPGPCGPISPWIKNVNGSMQFVPEMVPELIVPDLTDCKLRPYVSYRVPDVIQSEFTPKNLFQAIYQKKIVEDFKAGKLGSQGDPLEPSEQEKLSSEKAAQLARSTGTDIF